MEPRKKNEFRDGGQNGHSDETEMPGSRRGALAWALVSLVLYGLMATTFLSVRKARLTAGPTHYVAQTEYFDCGSPDGESGVILTASSARDGRRVILADDPEMWYGYPALSEDASRVVFIGARRDPRGGLTDRGLYMAEVLLDREGRPQEASPAVKVAASADISMFTIVPIWIENGRLVVYAAKVKTAPDRWVPHIFVADIQTGQQRNLTTRFSHGATHPVFSPETGRIAFTGMTIEEGRKRWDTYTIRPDGTDLRRLTSPASTDGAFNVTLQWVNGGQEVQCWTSDRAAFQAVVDGTQETAGSRQEDILTKLRPVHRSSSQGPG